MKQVLTVIGAGALGLAQASPVLSGPYINVEMNGSHQDGYQGRTTDLHVGFEGASDAYSYYLQAGPAVVSPEGQDSVVELSGKLGASINPTDKVSVYGEISFLTDEDIYYGTKIGAKYSF